MAKTYEYKFVRLETDHDKWLKKALVGTSPTDAAKERYQQAVHEHAKDGWRLLQIFAPGISAYGMAAYYELIFERETTSKSN